MNATKAEFDAMEPDEKTGFPGVYQNDNLVVPHPSPPQYDPTPGAVDRIAIMCVRRWFPLIVPLSLLKPSVSVAAYPAAAW